MTAEDPQDSLPVNLQLTLQWVEKYRPQKMEDIVAQDEIVKTLTSLLDSQRLPHLLFYGPPGTGKTSTILACARRIYGNNFHSMVLEQNASDDRGIAVVRDQIRSFASTKILFSSGPKLIILDEADQMTNDAQAALRRLIEKYTNNARFCIICNYVNKVVAFTSPPDKSGLAEPLYSLPFCAPVAGGCPHENQRSGTSGEC
jgi:replication factor C subunit 3/5